VSNRRFQRLVAASSLSDACDQGQARIDAALAQLADPDRARYRELERKCRSALDQQPSGSAVELLEQEGGLGRLLWVYLRLLLTRRSIEKSLNELLETELREAPPPKSPKKGAAGDRGCDLLEERIGELKRRIDGRGISEELRHSLTGQSEILQQRLSNRKEGLGKLEFLDAELTRIEEQVKLIQEQGSIASDSAAVSERIDQIAAGLAGTAQWVRDQHKIYGSVDLLEEAPPISRPRTEARREPQ
jgi:hypothetical protein